MPRWLIVLISALLLVCVGLPTFGYFVVLPKLQNAVSYPIEDAIAEVIAYQVDQAATGQPLPERSVTLDEINLDINTLIDTGDAVGFEVTNGDALIYGAVTTITTQSIEVSLIDMVFTAKPEIEDGMFNLVDVAFEKGLTGHLISADAFELGLERGINEALAEHGISPVSATLGNGVVTIAVVQTLTT